MPDLISETFIASGPVKEALDEWVRGPRTDYADLILMDKLQVELRRTKNRVEEKVTNIAPSGVEPSDR